MNHQYNKSLRTYARELRTETVSKAEKRLWKLLARKQQGVGFKRQRPILFYIVDFYAAEVKLIIEIDGSSHVAKGEYDRKRQTQLELLGNTFPAVQDLQSCANKTNYSFFLFF